MSGLVLKFGVFIKIIYTFLLLVPISWSSSDVKCHQYKGFCIEQCWDLKTWPIGEGVILKGFERIVTLRDATPIRVSNGDQYWHNKYTGTGESLPEKLHVIPITHHQVKRTFGLHSGSDSWNSESVLFDLGKQNMEEIALHKNKWNNTGG